jgi:hypothetical protein
MPFCESHHLTFSSLKPEPPRAGARLLFSHSGWLGVA